MPLDPITAAPNTSPTQGLDEQANPAPYIPSTLGDVFGAEFGRDEQSLSDWLSNRLALHGGNPAEGGAAPEQRVSVDLLRHEYPGVTGINEPLPRSVVETMQRQQQAEAKRADIYARYPTGIGHAALRFGAGVVASLLDPIDDAAFAVPVVGESRYAGWLAKAGQEYGTAGRLGVTVGVGAAQGAAGSAILDVARAGMGQPNMGLGDIATDALQNAFAGGLLHTGLGFHSDVLGRRFLETGEGQAAAADASLHDNAVRVAAAQMADDSPVEVRPVFDAARLSTSRADLLSSTAIDRAMPAYWDGAVDRAAGRPTQEATLGNDLAEQARHAAPDQVLDGRMVEAQRAIEQLRANGRLTPEEEAQLAAFEPQQGHPQASNEQPAPHTAQEGPVESAERVQDAGHTEPSTMPIVAAGEGGAVHADMSPPTEADAPYGDTSKGRQVVDQLQEEAFSRARRNAIARENGYETVDATTRQTLPSLRKAVKDLHDGKIDAEAFQARTESILSNLEQRRADRLYQEVRERERERGPDYIRERLLQAKRRGDLSEEGANLAEWFIHRNPRLVDDLGISIRNAGEHGSAGNYSPFNRVMTLFKGSANDTTAVHEMLHHLELMMPEEARQAILREWSRAIADQAKNGSERMRAYLDAVLKANESHSAADLMAAQKLLPEYSAYQYLNPSEFWAVNAARIMESRFGATSSIGTRLRQWFSELMEHAKGLLGLRSDASMLRALDALLKNGDGITEGGRMLSAFRLLNDIPQEEMGAAVKARQKLTAMQDMMKRHALADKVAQIRESGLSLAHGIDALTRGISEAVPGARDSTAQHQLAQQEFLIGRLVANLEKVPGAMEAWRRRILTAEWVQELAELNKQDGRPGISGSPLAQEIAKAVHDAQDIARLGMNRAGAWIGDYDGYVARTQHDPIKIHNAGFDRWMQDVLGGIDQAKTFEGLSTAEREDFLHNMWDALSTGVHMTADHGAAPKAPAFVGPGSMGKRASAARVLHWKDADSWRQYQEQYGDPVIERGVLSSLHRAGRDTALMERWGSNPKLSFDNLIQQVRQQYRGDHDAIAQLDKALPRIREEFAHLTGEASRPQVDLANKIRSSILALQDITKLGNVLLAHLSTTLTKPFQLQYLGIGRWKAYTSVLSNLMKDTSPEGRTVLENLRANATGQFQEMMGGYEPVDGIPGQLARLRQFSMRIGGLPWMLERQKTGTMWEVANFLGQKVGQNFDQLDQRTARGLDIYGITPAEWDALRAAPDHDRDGSGSVFLTPAAAMRADVDGLAGDRLGNAVDAEDASRIRAEVRDRLAMKLAAYYADAAERSTVTPGVQERAFWTLHAGRTWGPALGQYKGWAMAAVRTMWGQAIHGSNSRAESVKYLSELVGVGMAVGMARIAITDAMNGREPAMPNGDARHDALLMGRAMVAGGALGIYGDYLMGQNARAGESASDRAKDLGLNLLGPAFADMATTFGLAKNYASIPFAEDAGHALDRADAEATHFLTSHLPLANTFYLRLLSRWLVLDRLNEMADPGYLQRHQDAVQQRAGQEFWMAPTQYAGAAS
jgi:hypothetical protein